MIKTDILIIGAGFAGLSTAHHLASRTKKKIMILEQEKQLGVHASGNNAGMIRQALADPFILQLAIEGREAIFKAKWKGLSFKANGSLLLAKTKTHPELDAIHRALRKENLKYVWLSKEKIEKTIPVLKKGNFREGLFCPSDALVNTENLLDGFLSSVRAKRIPILYNRRLESIEKIENGFLVRAHQTKIKARQIVNAAGAGAQSVASKMGATELPFKAYRRHLFVSQKERSYSGNWPFVWDVEHGFYFRPFAKNTLMMSPCDKKIFNLKENAPQPDPGVQNILYRKIELFFKGFGTIKVKPLRVGLRTMAPDGRFVIGEDAKQKDFFWVAGLGGHGLTTSFSVGRLAADLILGRNKRPLLAKAFSPARFA